MTEIFSFLLDVTVLEFSVKQKNQLDGLFGPFPLISSLLQHKNRKSQGNTLEYFHLKKMNTDRLFKGINKIL